MKSTRRFRIVLVTAPDMKTARKLARAALEDRLIACANILPRVESLYWWEGRIESGREWLLVMKTTSARLGALEKKVVELHPYDTPEFIALSIEQGNRKYLNWLQAECS